MKMSTEVKSENSDSGQGQMTEDDLDCQLEHFIAAKKIESDPVLFAKLKDYAMSKNKMIQGFFDEEQKEGEPRKDINSLDDLKKIKKQKQLEAMNADS